MTKATRKMISFKVENLPAKERAIVDEWADGQFNIQQSLANIVMHVVRFVGNVDVMDFDVQRKLHTVLSTEPKIVVEQIVQKAMEEPVQQPVKQENKKPVSVVETDDLPSGDVMFEDD